MERERGRPRRRQRWSAALGIVLLAGAPVVAACTTDDTATGPAGTGAAGTTPGSAPGTSAGTTPGTTASGSTPTSAPSTEPTTAAPTTASPSSPSTAAAPPRSFTNVPAGVTVEVVADGLAAPWGLAFTPDGRAWVSERDTGTIRVIEPDGAVREAVRIPVDATGEGGLLGLATSPTYATDGTLYAYYTSATDNRVVRIRPDDGSISPVLTGIPKGPIHDGGRLAFGPDGKLYVGTGDAGNQASAQSTSSLGGKILRIEPDGSIPADNPFPGSPVWTYGHRNVQGLAWDGAGRLYATEFGPDVNDELNLITPGADYGWPEVTGDSGGRFTDPLVVLQPPEASPSGLTLVTRPGAWQGDLLFGGLRGQRVWRADLAPDGTVAGVTPLFEGTFGRVRNVAQAPDGTVWLLTNNRDGRGSPRAGDDLIVRITPPG